MAYVDGFLIPIPRKNISAYLKMARLGCRVWMDHGALSYCETVGEDLKTKQTVPFPKVIKAKAGETVIFAWIMFKSRAHRDKVNAAVMKDPRMQFDPKGKMPFNWKRMGYGGFEVLVKA